MCARTARSEAEAELRQKGQRRGRACCLSVVVSGHSVDGVYLLSYMCICDLLTPHSAIQIQSSDAVLYSRFILAALWGA